MKRQVKIVLKSIAASAKVFVRTFSRILTPPPRTIPTSCVNINSLLMHLCDFDQFAYQYIIKWLAYPLQNPGAKMHFALMVNGPQGTGKSMFFEEVVAAIHGPGGVCLTPAGAFATFNPWAIFADLLVVTDQVPTKFSAGAKAVVANPILTVNRKGAAPHAIQNRINAVFLSTSDDLLPIPDNRRLYVLECPPPRERLYYAAVGEEIRNGGVDAFREYLVRGVNLDGFNQFSEPPSIRVSAMLEVV